MATVFVYITGLFVAGWMFGRANPEVRGLLHLAQPRAILAPRLSRRPAIFGDPAVSIMLIISAIVCLVISFIAARWLRQRMALTAELHS